MAELTYFTVVGAYYASLVDSYDVDTDPDLVPLFGRIRFTPLVDAGDVVKAQTLTPPTNLLLKPVEADTAGAVWSNGSEGVKLVANTAVLELAGALYYQVDFPDGLTARGTQYQVDSFPFLAPTTAVTIDLSEVTPMPGQPATGPVPTSAVLTVNGRTGYVILGPSDINTAIATDPAATWTALGIAPSVNLPSYVDDVLEFANLAAFPGTGETGKIYVAIDTGDSYRWSGSTYIRISDRITASGITDSTATGRAVVTGDAAAGRTALSAAPDQGSSYYRRARTVADSNGTDDTSAVQAVFAEGAGEVVFRKGGTWIIDANPTTGMLEPLSNTRIIIEEGAIVQVKTNALDIYYLFNLDGVQNVTVEGMGTLLGDALVHTGSTGQHGHLINITNGSADCRVLGPLLLTHAWGDGIYIGGGTTAVNTDILIDGVIVDDCRREGISPFWVDGCTIRNSRIVDIASSVFNPGGPGSGIDVEPNDGQYVTDLTIENNHISGTAGNGIYVSTLAAGGVAPYTRKVIVRNNHVIGCGIAAPGASTASGPSGFTNGIYVRAIDDPVVINNVVEDSGFVGDTGFVSANIKSNLCNRPVIKGNIISGATGPGILVTGGTTPEIADNTVRNNGQRGISTGVAGAIIRGNHILDNNQAGGSSEHHVSISGDGCDVQGNVFRGSNGNSWVRVSSGSDSLIANNIGLGTAPTNKLSDAGTTTRKSLNFRVDTGVYESWDTSGATPVGMIELGHATDTTISRLSAGKVAVEGAEVMDVNTIHALTAKATPVDADEFVIVDSAASNVQKKTLWSSIKTTLAAWLGLLPSGTVVGLFNTSDQVTNFEWARHYWTGNTYTIQTNAGGTGAVRDAQLIAGTNASLTAFASTQGPTVGNVRLRANLSAASGTIAGVNGTLSAGSGTQYGLSLSPTITQTSTAGVTVLLVNLTETTTGSGTRLLADFQVAGTSKAKIDDTGVVSAVASGAAGTVPVYAAVPATASSTGTAGQMARDASFVYFCTAANTWVRAALTTW